jgi:hypothetical protein
MAAITTNQYLDGGTARTAGEAFAIGSGAKFTIRTDSRIHANAPASFLGSLGNPTFTDIGGELFIDATAVRWLAYTGGSGNAPAIGTAITQGGVSGYYLGCWASIGSAPTAVGSAIPASGFIKLREVTGGVYSAGALTGITATASGVDVAGWIEMAWDAGTNFVVGRVGKFTTRGQWFDLGTTNGSVGQLIPTPTSSSTSANNFCPGAFVETSPASGEYEFWQGLSSAANMWIKTAIGNAEGYTDKRCKFVKAYAGGNIQFGESVTMAGTYATVAGQASTYADIAITGTYTWSGDKVYVYAGGTAHLFQTGQQVYLDFTTGGGVDGTYTVTVVDAYNYTVALAGSGTGGDVTSRPGVTVTFTAHGYFEGESIYADFTSGTGVDGTYRIYGVNGANTYLIEYPHAAALTGGNVTANGRLQITATAHTMAIGNEVYCDFTTGGATDGRYIMRAVAANTIDINYPFSAAITTSNVTLRWTLGHVPAAGCKVRIPNILWAECATAARATNTVPNVTIATRPEFATTSAGAIDLEKIYVFSGRSIFDQAYSVRLIDCAFSETLQITECATAIEVTNVGVGAYSAQDVKPLQLTSNFAGGTLGPFWGHRPTLGTSDHAAEAIYCNGITFNNIETGIIGYARSSGYPMVITGSQNLTFNGLRVLNGYIPITTSVGITINDLDYNDRYIGRTSATTPFYAVTIGAGCDKITIDGVTFGMNNTVPDCHPYSGIINPGGATNLKFRNIGTKDSYLRTGEWAANYAACALVIASSGNNNTMKVQKVFAGRLRTGLMTTVNSDKNVTVEQVLSVNPWLHSTLGVRTELIATLNANSKGLTSGVEMSTGQTSVYGTHWLSLFRGNAIGAVLLAMNEPTAETLAYYTKDAGTVLFNSAGGVEMRAIGAKATWEMPYFAQGHTGFGNVIPVMSGGTIANYRFYYQIDKGAGYSALSAQLDAAGLQAALYAETGIDPAIGFRLKLTIQTTTANSTAITFLRLSTTTSLSAQQNINYPLDTATVAMTGLVTGSRVKATKVSDDTVLFNGAEAGGSISFQTEYIGAIRLEARKASSAPFYQPYVTQLTSISGSTVSATALQQLDE